MPDDDIEWLEPNDQAYLKSEQRTGPPLDYVAEKLRRSLETIHALTHVINDLTDSDSKERLLWNARHAFHYGLVSFLALNNLLALTNEHDIGDRLLRLSHDEFVDWLNKIQREGSVTG